MKEVEFCCSPPELNLPKGVRVNWTSPTSGVDNERDNCLMYDISYKNLTVNAIMPQGIGTKPCSKWDYLLEGSQQTLVSQFDLVCGKRYLISLTESSYMFGDMIGALVFGILADKFGRY